MPCCTAPRLWQCLLCWPWPPWHCYRRWEGRREVVLCLVSFLHPAAPNHKQHAALLRWGSMPTSITSTSASTHQGTHAARFIVLLCPRWASLLCAEGRWWGPAALGTKEQAGAVISAGTPGDGAAPMGCCGAISAAGRLIWLLGHPSLSLGTMLSPTTPATALTALCLMSACAGRLGARRGSARIVRRAQPPLQVRSSFVLSAFRRARAAAVPQHCLLKGYPRGTWPLKAPQTLGSLYIK